MASDMQKVTILIANISFIKKVINQNQNSKDLQ